MERFLQSRLGRVIRRHQQLVFFRQLALAWAVAAAVAALLFIFRHQLVWPAPVTILVLTVLAGGVAVALAIRAHRQRPDYREIARKIEAVHPELQGALLTAVQLPPGAEAPNYLQFRLLQSVVDKCQESDWRDIVPPSRLLGAHTLHFAALACFAILLVNLHTRAPDAAVFAAKAEGLVVTPGDTSVERGESLVVLARFGGNLPANVNLVLRESGAAARAVPLVKSLADPVFGGSVSEVHADLIYHLEYAGKRTRDFKVSVFDHPRLEKADAQLAFPEYTALAPRRIENTRRISAVEGTRLDLALQLNKPVASAHLVARDAARTTLPLEVDAERAVARLPQLALAASQTYDLRLVDADGRKNKLSTPFVIDVVPNRPPELRLTSPRGDVRPSALEEVGFEGTIWDDFGSPAYGIAYTIVGGETRSVELGGAVPAKEKRAFAHLLKLEELNVQPDQLVSWYAWAEDIGPDGNVRRTSSDLFFGEIRPFDQIFRESQAMQQQQDNAQQGGPAGERQRLVELQRQIVNATWNLHRQPPTPKYADDVKVIHESQRQALGQAAQALEEAFSPTERGGWTAVTSAMETALKQLQAAEKTPEALAQALPAEQAALQNLLKMQSRDTAVTRGQNRGQGGGGEQANQRQIDQLDLKQSENRYETQRQARSLQSPERREELQVMNRLQELARRQQDLNERLKELQTALQEARTEQEREEIRRRLKRLQEEQQQMLADVDEVRQRMDRPENQSRMNEERQRLDDTRDDLQRAAEAASEGSVAQALASGTRAQRQLQDLRDDLRKQNSSEFAEDLREMRQEARDLARQQEDVSQKLAGLGESTRKSLSGSDGTQQVIEQLEQQQERVQQLVDRATQISEAAENSEPLVSRHLYDSLRKLGQDDANTVKELQQELMRRGMITRSMYERMQQMTEQDGSGRSLELTAELVREGNVTQAGRIEQRARDGINELRRGIERAAESVIGDDAEGLRLAQSEIDRLTEELQREMAQEGAGTRGGDRRQAGATGRDGERTSNGQEQGERGTGEPGQDRETDGASAAGLAEASERSQQRQPGQGEDSATPGQPTEGSSPGQESLAQAGQPGGQQGRGREGGGEGRQGGGQRQAGGGLGDALGNDAGGPGGGFNFDNFFTEGARPLGGPLIGEGFAPWADRLREVEEMLEQPELRDAVATARERARLMRREFTQERKKPDWAVVELEIVKPLVEVRTRIREELARREPKNDLVPIDRDPVPNRYTELVRRYYEELGKDE